jgi:hypothetical protein
MSRSLVGGVDDGLGALEAAGGEGGPQALVDRRVPEQQFSEHGGVLKRLGAALGQGGRAGVCGVPDQHDAAPVPRRGEHMRLEQRVVDRGGVGQARPDVIPGTVIGGRDLEHRRELLLGGQRAPVPRVLDDVGVQRVLTGGAVAGDIGRAAVVQVGAGDAGRARAEGPPDAHPRGADRVRDAEHVPGRGADAVRRDDEVIPAGGAVGECDVDARGVLAQSGVRGAEADLGTGRGGAIDEDPR